MRRREFVAGLAGTAAIGFDARAQSSARIGHIDNGPPETRHEALLALRRGLSETGYVEGQNLIVDYAWAAHEEDFTRLDDRFRESCHKQGIHLGLRTPMYVVCTQDGAE